MSTIKKIRLIICINDSIYGIYENLSNMLFSFISFLSFNSCLVHSISSPSSKKTQYILYLIIDLAKNPIDLVSVGLADDSNVYDWEILIMGPDGTLYEGGFFKARLVFPQDFPNMPRKLRSCVIFVSASFLSNTIIKLT